MQQVTLLTPYTSGDSPPTPTLLKQKVEDNTGCDDTEDHESEYIASTSGSTPILLDQAALNDLVRDLGLPKDESELPRSRLQEKNLLAPGTTFSWYRNREKSLVRYYSEGDNYVLCNDVNGFIRNLEVFYNTDQWRLFIDSSKRSLKAVLLHNSNKYASIPVAHSSRNRDQH